MKICFTLDDVIRAKTERIYEVYCKFVDQDKDSGDFSRDTNDYFSELPFDTKSEYNEFLYKDYPFEIFGEAEVCEKMLDKELNLWLIDMSDKYEFDNLSFMLANPFEFNQSIGFTYFFLSKIATRIREVYLPTDSSTIFDKCDVLVTADPKLLNNKPEGKVTVKIETGYNKECESDYTFESLSAFLKDDTVMDSILDK